jgi:hypothetical protein
MLTKDRILELISEVRADLDNAELAVKNEKWFAASALLQQATRETMDAREHTDRLKVFDVTCQRCGKKFKQEGAFDALCDDCSWEEWYEQQLERSREFDEEVA